MSAPPEIKGAFSVPPALPPNTRGALWMIASCIGATAMSVAVRVLSEDMPTVQIAFLRSILGLWVLIPVFLSAMLMMWRANPGDTPPIPVLRFSRPWLHLLRGVLFACALFAGFYALGSLPLTTATTLFFLAPVFATLLAAVFRGETFGIRRATAIAAAFTGALIILRPGFAEISAPMLLAVASAFCFAVALLISRPLSEADGTLSILVSSSIIACLTLAGPALWNWVWFGVELWGLLIVLVLASSLRMFADIRAYTAADAGFLAPFAFLRLLFIAVAAWIFFREGMDWPTTIGAGIIIGATVFIAWRESRLKKRAAGVAEDERQT